MLPRLVKKLVLRRFPTNNESRWGIDGPSLTVITVPGGNSGGSSGPPRGLH
jgi:hypothetical protein